MVDGPIGAIAEEADRSRPRRADGGRIGGGAVGILCDHRYVAQPSADRRCGISRTGHARSQDVVGVPGVSNWARTIGQRVKSGGAVGSRDRVDQRQGDDGRTVGLEHQEIVPSADAGVFKRAQSRPRCGVGRYFLRGMIGRGREGDEIGARRQAVGAVIV